MASQLRVDEIIASTGSSVAIGTAGGSVTLAGDFTVDTSKGLNVGTGATIFSPATNVLALGTNNAERVRIDSSGLIANNGRSPSSYGSPNLLISGTDSTLTLMGDGSTNSTSFTGIKFRVAGASTGDYTKAGIFSRREGGYNDLSIIFALNTDANANSVAISDEKLRITSSGNIGIGTDNPQTALVVDRDWVNNYGSINIKSSSDVLSGVGFRTDGGYAGGFIYRDGTTGNFFELNAQGSREIRALLNGSEALRITSSGDVGIGDATPAEKLEVKGDVLISTGQNATLYLGKGAEGVDGVTKIKSVQTGADTDELGIAFFTHPSTFGSAISVEKLRIDATGSMGLGVTPEPQGSGFINFQFGGLGNLGATSSQSAGGAIYLYNNIYRATAGQWRYLVTDEATRYQALNGRHQFDIAPSGTADTEANFAEKVRIDTDGLKFNGDTAAANALDDYEEGTWTAGFTGTTYTRSGYYTKIGRQVFVFVYGSGMNVTSSTSARITGLPFTVRDNYAAGTLTHNTYAPNSGGNGYFNVSDTRFTIINTNNTTATNTSVGNPKYIMMAGCYNTDS